MAIIGYARVSSQLEDLKAAGAETIYREKISGAHAGRPQLAKLMATLKAGDVVLDDRFREPGIFRKGGVDGTDELLVDSLFGTD